MREKRNSLSCQITPVWANLPHCQACSEGRRNDARQIEGGGNGEFQEHPCAGDYLQ